MSATNPKFFLQRENNPPAVRGRTRTVLETDCAGEGRRGAKVEAMCCFLACVFHGGRVAGASALARGVGVRVAGGRFAAPTTGVGRTRARVGPSTGSGRTGFGRGACGGEWGMRWGTETPRAAPLPWVPARAGTTMGGVVGCVGARGSGQGGGPLSRAGGSRTAPTTGVERTRAGVMRWWGPLRVRTGFDRLRTGRADGFGKRACGGEWGMRWGTETPARAAPALGSRESGNDDGGCGGMRWREGFGSGWVARGPLSRAGGSRTAPTTGEFAESRVCAGGPFVALRTGSGRTGLGGARVRWGVEDAMGPPRKETPRAIARPCPGFPRERERRWGVWWDALARGVRVRVQQYPPWPVPARSCGRVGSRTAPTTGVRGWMRGLLVGRPPSTGSGRTVVWGRAPSLGVPASAGMTGGGGATALPAGEGFSG